jgi:hypothetical protein
LRLLRQHAGDIALVMRLNAQYASMVRTSLSVLGRLMRVQALRHKRDAIGGAADQDAWTQHVVERSMAQVVDPDPRPPEAASPERARSKSPERARSKSPKPAPVATQAKASPAYTDQTTGEHASENETDSQDPAFETWLRERPWNRGSTGPDDTALRILREAMAKPGLESPASGRVNLGSTANDWHGEREKASA